MVIYRAIQNSLPARMNLVGFLITYLVQHLREMIFETYSEKKFELKSNLKLTKLVFFMFYLKKKKKKK